MPALAEMAAFINDKCIRKHLAMNTISRIESLLTRAVALLAMVGLAALVVMMALTFLDVTGRTLFGRALTGTVETITLLMGVVVFCGLAKTEISNRHVVVDVLHNLFPRPVNRFVTTLNLVLAVFITSVMTWRLTLAAITIFEEQETTMIWSLPYWPVAIVMVIGMVLFLAILILKLMQNISQWWQADQ